jgi:hypothetical protein
VGDNQTISPTQNTETNNVMGPDKEKFFMERTLQELLHRLENNIGETGLQTMLKF